VFGLRLIIKLYKEATFLSLPEEKNPVNLAHHRRIHHGGSEKGQDSFWRITEGYESIEISVTRIGWAFPYTSGSFLPFLEALSGVGKSVLFGLN